MIRVYPAINEKNKRTFVHKLTVAETLSPVIHVDITDAKFVPWKTVSMQTLGGISNHRFIIHYMGKDPYAKVPMLPDNTWQYLFHYEAAGTDFHAIVKACKARRIKPVLAISPSTKISEVKELLHTGIGVHILTVEPGSSGQALMTWCLRKVREIKKHNERAHISIDGGVNNASAKLVKLYPINSVAASSAIFERADPIRAYKELKKALNS